MFQRKPRRFRSRSNGRNQRQHGHSHSHMKRNNSFSNGHSRNNFRSTQSAEKLLEKYNNLAKEAISSGDKTLGENYLQHADHFMRIIEDKNRNRNLAKDNIVNKTPNENKNLSDVNNTNDNEQIKNKD